MEDLHVLHEVLHQKLFFHSKYISSCIYEMMIPNRSILHNPNGDYAKIGKKGKGSKDLDSNMRQNLE